MSRFGFYGSGMVFRVWGLGARGSSSRWSRGYRSSRGSTFLAQVLEISLQLGDSILDFRKNPVWVFASSG